MPSSSEYLWENNQCLLRHFLFERPQKTMAFDGYSYPNSSHQAETQK